jgi:hypothetical protein
MCKLGYKPKKPRTSTNVGWVLKMASNPHQASLQFFKIIISVVFKTQKNVLSFYFIFWQNNLSKKNLFVNIQHNYKYNMKRCLRFFYLHILNIAKFG